jgi:KEOPS complex subunit Cgi121
MQAFNPDSILSENHIFFSVNHALNAFSEKRNIAKTIGNEILLRVAATRRIDEAIRKVGVKDPKNVLLFISGERIDEKEILRQLDAEKVELKFGNENGIATKFQLKKAGNYKLEDLLFEKIALLELER